MKATACENSFVDYNGQQLFPGDQQDFLLTTVNGILKGYWFRDGYIRTSSEEYNLKDIDNVMVHLTNDAIQRRG